MSFLCTNSTPRTPFLASDRDTNYQELRVRFRAGRRSDNVKSSLYAIFRICSIFDAMNHGFAVAGRRVSSRAFWGEAKSVARRPHAAEKDNHNPGTARFPVT